MEKLPEGTKVTIGQHEAEIVSYIAEGGFAHIYRVKCTPIENDSEDAVLKRVIVKSKPELNILRKEVDTMKRLASSRYVVRYYDSNAQKLEDGTYEVLLLMEYCPNKSLLDYMNLHLKTKLRVDQITKIMYQTSQALADMHSMKLIHRDLKIENILIDSNGDFKLADFGSTSSYIPPPKNQEEFQWVAHDIIHNTTPQYRAPEMIDLYRGLSIDDKSDIWALGVFLFKLMYYTTPFETQGELAILHGYFQFPELPKYPSRLKNLVIIMLQVNPMLRPNIYQVLYEICDLINKPVPIEDSYGFGKYDFDAYAKYQQHILLQQQQQAQIQQEYMLKKQQEQMAYQQLQQQQQQQQQAETKDEEEVDMKRSKSAQSIQPQELTRSSKSSVGDLKSLNTGFNEGEGEEEDAEEEDVGDEVEDVASRFPDLDDIEAVKQKFPELDEVETGKFIDGSKSDLREGSKSPLDESDVPNAGLRLSSTEAWTLPSNDKKVNVDGVFHKDEEKPLKLKSSFDNLFDFETEATPASQPSSRVPSQTTLPLKSVSQPTSRHASQFTESPVSRNPFPVSKNPFPTGNLEVKKVLRPERSGGNPWVHFQQYPSSQNIQQSVQQSIKQSVPQSVPQNAHRPEQKPPLPLRHEQTPKLGPQLAPAHTSPVITLTPADVKLIDLDDGPKEHRPKLDLHMKSFELDTENNVNDDDDGDTDTDSNGDLKVEVMKVRTTSKSSTEARTSTELKRLNLDLQELDLDEDVVTEDDEKRHSRRSLSLKRNSSGLRKTSRSRSDRESKEKRKSFLGF